MCAGSSSGTSSSTEGGSNQTCSTGHGRNVLITSPPDHTGGAMSIPYWDSLLALHRAPLRELVDERLLSRRRGRTGPAFAHQLDRPPRVHAGADEAASSEGAAPADPGMAVDHHGPSGSEVVEDASHELGYLADVRGCRVVADRKPERLQAGAPHPLEQTA